MTTHATKGSEAKRIKQLEQSLKPAIAIIRNDAATCEFHQPNKAETRYRWANEIEVESGLRKPEKPRKRTEKP